MARLNAKAREMQTIPNDNNADSSRDNSRIIGGREADVGRYPFAVSLSDSYGHFCGGSLIAADVVLTAAHCQGGNYSVIIGRHDLSDDQSGEEIAIDYELPHPDYDDATTDNDFNLVFLSRAVSAEYLNLVTLNTDAEAPSVGDSVYVMGWGDTAKEDDIQMISDVLMGVEVKMISNDECDSSKGFIGGYDETYQNQITSNMMCAKDSNKDSCQGDSGGPAIVRGQKGPNGKVNDVQVGVVSWGVGCAHGSFPGVYARVSAAQKWIEDEVCSRSSDPPSSFKCKSTVDMTDDAGSATSAADSFVLSLHHQKEHKAYLADQWATTVDEDFSSSFGFFGIGVESTLYNRAKSRYGVVRISGGASITSKRITNVYSGFKVLLTFQFIGVETGSGVCLDYSDDDGLSWKESSCFTSNSSFENDVWYDKMSTEFKSERNSLMIRVRSNGSQGDILVDRVTVQGSTIL
jgi:trypsin